MKKIIICLLLIFSTFMLIGCNGENHEHTFKYISYEETHFKQYTCGCPSSEIIELHSDSDIDFICDICAYSLKEPEFIDCTYYFPYQEDCPISITFKEDKTYSMSFTNKLEDSGRYIIKNGEIHLDTNYNHKAIVFKIVSNAIKLVKTEYNYWHFYDYNRPVIYYLDDVNMEEKIAIAYQFVNDNSIKPRVEKIYSQYKFKGHDVYAFIIKGDSGNAWGDKIYGTKYTFTYINQEQILLYYKGGLYNLNYAYSCGMITDKELSKLNEGHHNCQIAHSYDDGKIVQIPGGGEEILYECYLCDASTTVDLPEDFSFSLSWGFDGHYDSKTGQLKNGYNYDLNLKCETTMYLDKKELLEIYRILYNGNLFNIKESFSVSEDLIEPSYVIKIRYILNGEEVNFKIWGASHISCYEWSMHQDLGYAYNKVIEEYITSSEEYKALPPNQNLYC